MYVKALFSFMSMTDIISICFGIARGNFSLDIEWNIWRCVDREMWIKWLWNWSTWHRALEFCALGLSISVRV